MVVHVKSQMTLLIRLKSFLLRITLIIEFWTNGTPSPFKGLKNIICNHINPMKLPILGPVRFYLVFEQFFNLEMHLELGRNLLVKREPLIVQDGRSLMVSNVDQHVSVREILSVPLDQHPCGVGMGQMRLPLDLKAAIIAADTLAKGELLGHLGDPVIVKLVPPVLLGRLNESEVVAGIDGATVHEN